MLKMVSINAQNIEHNCFIKFSSLSDECVALLVNDLSCPDDLVDKIGGVVAEEGVPAERQRFDVGINLPPETEKRLHLFVGVISKVV